MCLELNAHAIILILITLRDSNNDESYLPWLLGSQCCEKMFRLARSMTSTFSIMINFGMLGLLRRLHRLQIQSHLQAESCASGIIYPQLHKHKRKSGKNVRILHSLKEISNTPICEAVKIANDKAKEAVKKLGMEILNLDVNEVYSKEAPDSDDDDSEHLDQPSEDSNLIEHVVKDVCMEDPEDIKSDIERLSSTSVITDDVKQQLCNMQQSILPCTKSHIQQNSVTIDSNTTKHTQLLELSNGEYIRKTTAIWLLQEGERVSSDRLFRVRSKQPYSNPSTDIRHISHDLCADLPCISDTVVVGDMCVFEKGDHWEVGRILQFAYCEERKLSAYQYKGSTAQVQEKGLGVLCSWFKNSSDGLYIQDVCK